MDDDTGFPSEASELTRVFTALSDRTCRRIIRETVAEALTADELADRCDRSRSTIYRKAETLVEGGLLEQRTRIRTDRQNVTQYRTAIDSVLVEITESEGIELRFDPPSLDETDPDTGA